MTGKKFWVFILLALISIPLVSCGLSNQTETSYTLTIDVIGQGSVLPTSGQTYAAGTEVLLQPTPANPDWSFAFWSGSHGAQVSQHNSIIMNSNKQITANFTENCIDFEEPILGTKYIVSDLFTDSGVTMRLKPFTWSNGQMTNDGFAEIEDRQYAGGTGQDIEVNNILIDFDFVSELTGLTIHFGEYGGNLNIIINGELRNIQNFADIDGMTIQGVEVYVTNGYGNDLGKIKLIGLINDFAIGGQELWIDDLEMEF